MNTQTAISRPVVLDPARQPSDPGSLGSSRRLVGVAMIAAPLLMAAGAAAFVTGVGVPGEPFDDGSWVEGVCGVFALALFVPVYLALAARLAIRRPRLAGFARAGGLIGAVAGVTWESLRVFGYSMLQSGITTEQAEAFATDHLSYSWPMSISVLFPLTSIVLGVALAGRELPRWQGWSLAGGGVGFVTAMALGLVPTIAFPIAAILWLIALVPLGVETLRSREA